MIWNSIAVMTVFDVLIVALVSWCGADYLGKRAGRSGIGSRRADILTVTGLSTIAIFFIADLSTMYVLPLFVSWADSMAAMRFLHLEVSWLFLLSSVGFLAAGYHWSRGAAISLVNELENARGDLTREIERQRLLIDSSPDAIPVQITYVDRNERAQFANLAYAQWIGVPQDDIIGMHVRDLHGEEFYDSTKGFRDRAFAGEVSSNEGEWRWDDGRHMYFRATRVPHFSEHGEVLGYFAIIVDITEHHDREAQLRQAQKMEAVGQLTGGVAHEFNNLLMVIVGNLEMTMDGVSDDATRKTLSSAMKAAMRGAELTQRLLTFSRKQILSVGPVDLNELVLGLHDLLRRTLGETIAVELELADDLPKTLADRGQIESALLNFVLNSRDAMAKGGTITVRTSKTTLNADAAIKAEAGPGHYVSLEVADTGHGMTAETLAQAFEPFFTTRDVGEGTGLGLSVVYGFAKQSGGFVEIDSAAGHGTTIRLCLPCAGEEEPMVEEEAPIPEEPVGGRAVILVVEDDADVRALVVGLLIDLGYDAVEAEDGQSALARLHECPDIDLLFTDVVLPFGMSGHDVASEATRRRPGLKVVFTSGYPDQQPGDRSVDGQDDVIVAKPYRKSELAEKLAAALGA